MKHTIDEIIEKLRAEEKAGTNIIETPFLMIVDLNDFEGAKIKNDFSCPKFDLLLIQANKTLALWEAGRFEGANEAVYLLSWIVDHDPKKDLSPCEECLFLFSPGESEPKILIQPQKN